jgi:allantoate deiminase
MSLNQLARTVMDRIAALGRISEDPGRLTRTFCSPAMRQANDLVATWMRAAGMPVSQDAIGNLIGRLPGPDARAKTFILGSHLDTVRDAGKFDGPLGVLIAIACAQHLHDSKIHLPFALEVIGFADEEGVRYQTTYLGSKAMAGKLTERDLKRIDARGITMSDAVRAFGGNPDQLSTARRDPRQLLGYAEVHIEQGPVLEKKNQPVGVVTAIAGQTRASLRFVGHAGHAGTTPMALRHDALAAAARFIVAAETIANSTAGLVATVGQIEALPGASNVIPGEVSLTLDVRHAQDSARQKACSMLQKSARALARKYAMKMDWETVHDVPSVPCSRELSALLAKAVRRHLVKVTQLPSGAGHDAAVMSGLTPVAMLFVRCKGGISHHPAESATAKDIPVAIAVMNDFLQFLANPQPPSKKKHA